MNRYLVNIQALRGVAASLVVLSHLGVVEAKYGGDTILPGETMLGFSGVDLFFVISGFIMVHVTRGDFGAPRKAGAFLFSRFTRIYPLYWLVSLFLIVIWLRWPDMVFASATGSPDLIKSLALWPESRPPLLAVGWTLIHELYFYLVFAAMLLAPRRWLPGLLALWMGAVTLGALAGLGGVSPELAIVFHPLTLEFVLGAAAALIFHALPGEKRAGVAILALGVAAFCAALIYAGTNWPGAFPDHWARALLFGPPGALIVYGLAAMEHRGRAAPAWSGVFGDWSYALYLTHVLTLSALGRLWAPVATGGAIDNIAALIILSAAAIAASAAAHILAEKPMLHVTRTLRRRIFGRKPAWRGAGAP